MINIDTIVENLIIKMSGDEKPNQQEQPAKVDRDQKWKVNTLYKDRTKH